MVYAVVKPGAIAEVDVCVVTTVSPMISVVYVFVSADITWVLCTKYESV